jgi:hypothetical protein
MVLGLISRNSLPPEVALSRKSFIISLLSPSPSRVRGRILFWLAYSEEMQHDIDK